MTAYVYGVDNFHCMKLVFKVFDSNFSHEIFSVKYNQTVCRVTRDTIIDHRRHNINSVNCLLRKSFSPAYRVFVLKL